MKKRSIIVIALLLAVVLALAACGGKGETPQASPTEGPAQVQPTEAPAEAKPTEAPAEEAPAGEKVQIRWFVGLGTGTDPEQQEVQQQVVEQFNKTHDNIELVLEVVPYDSARDTLSTEIASGNGPDIIGPVGIGGSNAFYGQWLDLAPLIEKTGFDTSIFNEELVKFYQTEEGQVGLPFAVFPAAVFYQKEMFDEAGLNYPPQKYGEKYVMPDGSEVEWNWDVIREIGKILTVDANGNDATMDEFDPDNVVQYGYYPQWQHPNHMGAFFKAGSLVAEDGKTAQIPDAWRAAWHWYYDGIWKDKFIPSDPVVSSPEFGAGNAFNSGKVAMAITHMWYTCCITDAGESWDLAALPAYEGEVHGRVDADTFRIWKGTKHPDEAFEVLTYLLTNEDAAPKLLTVYGAMPALPQWQDAFFQAKSEQYPWVENWDIMKAGLNYPDNPSAEGYMPNWNEAWDRVGAFGSLMANESGLDLDKEIDKLREDLQVIFDKASGKAPVATPEPAEEGKTGFEWLDRAYAGEFAGTTVTLLGVMVDEEARKMEMAVKPFEEATGIDVQYTGTKEFETQINVRVDAGDAPDVVDFPQPGLLSVFASQGKVVDVSSFMNMDKLQENYKQSWLDMATMPGPDGNPVMAGVWHRTAGKSYIWYPKKAFEEAGYQIPTTWDELMQLTQTIADDGDTAWCIGIESGAATGWVATDWIENLMLRTTSPENYDKWVAGELKFESPEVKRAAQLMGDIWLNPDYVYGGREGIVSTFIGDAPAPMFQDPPACWFHAQAPWITGFFPEGLEPGVDYDFFVMPPVDEEYDTPILVAGDIMAMFNDRPEVRALMEYFATGKGVEAWVKAGGAISPHNDSSLDWYTNDIDRRVAESILNAQTVRFDASDLMPAEVGTGAFWKAMTDWISGSIDLDTALKEIDEAWPKQ